MALWLWDTRCATHGKIDDHRDEPHTGEKRVRARRSKAAQIAVAGGGLRAIAANHRRRRTDIHSAGMHPRPRQNAWQRGR